MTLGLILLVAGVIAFLVGFAIAANNMASVAKNPDDMLDSQNNPFVKHLGAMVVMAFGGGSALIGLVLIVIALVGKHA